MKACICSTSMFCKRESLLVTISTQQNEKSTQICKRKIWITSLTSSVTMGKGVIKESDYKSNRIFTLKCVSNNLVLVSVKLKPSYSKLSQGARKIIEKAERQLLQERIRCINKTIEDSGNSININKTRLASMVTNVGDLEECSKFKEEVSKDRYGKVKARQVRKPHNLISKNKYSNNRPDQENKTNNSAGQGSNASNSNRPNNSNNNQLPNNNISK